MVAIIMWAFNFLMIPISRRLIYSDDVYATAFVATVLIFAIYHDANGPRTTFDCSGTDWRLNMPDIFSIIPGSI